MPHLIHLALRAVNRFGLALVALVAYAVAIALVMAFIANTAQARPRCAPLSDLTEAMAGTHGEHPAAQGVTSDGSLLIAYAAPDGSWTIFLVRPAGYACAVAAGKGWMTLTPGDDDRGDVGKFRTRSSGTAPEFRSRGRILDPGGIAKVLDDRPRDRFGWFISHEMARNIEPAKGQKSK